MSLLLKSQRFENAEQPALIILHGLLGSARNWVTIGRALQAEYDVHLLDLRNHGDSPHAESMRWSELVADLESYRERDGLKSFILMGHSLGGKIAMRYSCTYSEVVERLVIVDIAAKEYPPYHDSEFRAMKRLAVTDLMSRKEAEESLSQDVPDWALRQFLLTNLVRDAATGAFKWQINLEALQASLPHIRQNSLRTEDRFEKPTLLILGGKSNFVSDLDVASLANWFPALESRTLPEAGHNVHVEDRSGFLEVWRTWFAK